MKKTLPIEENVRIYSYTYYSFMQAIVANEYRTGKKVAVVNLPGGDDWKFVSHKMTLMRDGDLYTLEGSQYGIDLNAMIYRKLNQNDYQEMELLYYQYASAFGKISYFISKDEPKNCSDENRLLEFGTFCYEQLFFVNEQGVQTCFPRRRCNRMTLALGVEGEKYKFSCKQEEVDTPVCDVELSDCNHDLYLCVYVNLKDNSYYDWLFQNFLQLKYNKESEYVKLEFDFMIKRFWKYFSVNNFIDYSIEEIGFFQKLDMDILDYVKKKLSSEYYIETDLNSYDIDGADYYLKEDYLHTCLIYGYDDETEKLYLLCDSEGKLKKGEIQYKHFNSQMIENLKKESENKGMIISHFYNPDPDGYLFSVDRLKHDIRCYLNGRSVINSDVIIPIHSYVYGMEVYNEIMSEKGLNSLIEDIRISAVIKEHKMVMLERFDYLLKKSIWDSCIANRIISITKKLYKNACIIQNNSMYGWLSIKKSQHAKETILACLKEMQAIEQDLYPVALKALDLDREKCEIVSELDKLMLQFNISLVEDKS